jgi:uncharacterized membrane protein
MTTNPQIPFRAAAVQPVECVKAAWELVKPQYWLFLGIVFVGMLVGSAVPLGILMGPMMCGIYLTYFKTRRGEPIEFGTLFKGFDYFGPSVIATLLHAVPIMAIVVPAYILFYVAIFVTAATQGERGGEPAVGLALMAFFAFIYFVVIVLVVILSILFTFAFPLIVDHGLPGFDAVKLSFKAAFANFWRLIGLSLLNGCLGILGVLLCIVGVYLIVPITMGATALAYEQVFGLRNPADVVPNVPPPPPSF